MSRCRRVHVPRRSLSRGTTRWSRRIWYFDPADKAKIGFQLATPAGTFSTLSPASDLDDGFALIEVDNSTGQHNGAARAVTVAAADVSNAVGLDVQAESEIEMLVDLEGGTLADNRAPVIRVQLDQASRQLPRPG